ncbi:MAG: hypothetical protein WCX31_17300 [Salinivirgaceae bacterium]|jgi:hypothetical protein
MQHSKVNRFVFKGEIAEVLSNHSAVITRLICKPGALIIEIPSSEPYQLGDEVLITGSFICEKIENINHFNTNH